MAAEGPPVETNVSATGNLIGTGLWHGSLFYKSSSNGKLASLNKLVIMLEDEVDVEGNFQKNLGLEINGTLYKARQERRLP